MSVFFPNANRNAFETNAERISEEPKSEAEAVAESERRARLVMAYCGHDDDAMAKLFTVTPFEAMSQIYQSLTSWPAWRKEIVERFCQIKFTDLIFEACIYCVTPNATMPNLIVNSTAIQTLFGLLTEATDCSRTVCRLAINHGMIPFLIENISLPKFTAHLDAHEQLEFIYLNLMAIHNISKLAESKPYFEQAVEKIMVYCSSDVEKIQISAICSVACLLGTAPVDMMSEHEILLEKLANFLKMALGNEGEHYHRYLGFSAEELVQTLVYLAVNNDCKKKIAASGTLPLLVDMLKSKDVVEAGRAVDCLWVLTFNEAVKHQIAHVEGCVEALEKLAKHSSNSSLRLDATRTLECIKTQRTPSSHESSFRLPFKTEGAFSTSAAAGEPCDYCRDRFEKLLNDAVEKIMAKQESSNSRAAFRHIDSAVRQWDNDMVLIWLKKENLDHINLPDFDGATLVAMHEMKHYAPRAYYSSLGKWMAISFVDQIRLTAVIDKLFEMGADDQTE